VPVRGAEPFVSLQTLFAMKQRPNYSGIEMTEDNVPAPEPGTVGVKHWDRRTFAFVVLRSYTEAVDVSDSSRAKEWKEHEVTVCQYTEGEHEGETFYLWGERWDDVTDVRSPNDVCFNAHYTEDQLKDARKRWERHDNLVDLFCSIVDLGIDATDVGRLRRLWDSPRTREVAVPNNL